MPVPRRPASAPARAASSLFAYSNPQPFEQIIKIHLYLICLLELIEFLRLVNVTGCALPPNGDPAAGAAGAALGFHPSQGTKPTLGHGTGCPRHPQPPVGNGWWVAWVPAPSQLRGGCSAAPGTRCPNLHGECIKRSPNPMGFPRLLPAVPRWLWRGHGEPFAAHPTPLPESASTCLAPGSSAG